MKSHIKYILTAIALIWSLAFGVVVQYHHHDSDGAVCMHCEHEHGDDAAPNAESCALHLDCFCCDGSHHHVALPAMAEMDRLVEFVCGICAEEQTIVPIRTDIAIVKAGYDSPSGLRAPPVKLFV